jgi:signal transduction histidine kinase/ActR/RegA family two-component response regulator
MKLNYRTLKDSLAFRIIIPVILFLPIIGLLLYSFVLRSVSDFADTQIRTTFLNITTDVYRTIAWNFNELSKIGPAGDEKKAKIARAETVSTLETFMKKNRLTGAIMEDNSEILSIGDLPQGFKWAVEQTSHEKEVRPLTYEGKRYYIYHFEFMPWNWHIILSQDATLYSRLITRVKIAYGVTGGLVFISLFLHLYFFNRTIKKPISRIITSLEKGEKPDYKGITEFEYLGSALRDAIDQREKETRMLNTIYHIAISRRGDEFFQEAVMAIDRVFELNSYIGRIIDRGDHVQVAALYLNGGLKNIPSISLKGTPCEGVITKKHMCVIEKDAYKEFPRAEVLTSLRADSYIGLAIFDRKGDVVGILAAFGKQREFTESDVKVFQTIGQMIATEFEIQEKEKDEERMQEELLQSQKMEAVGTLAGGIAHDFNNMLQGVLGYASLLKMKVPETDPIFKPLEVIERSAEKAAELTKQLLGFARKGKYVLEPLNLNRVVDDVFKIITRTFDRAIEIRTALQNDIWTVEGDKAQIEHVVLNLCLNARDAMPAGGTLSITTSNRDIKEEVPPYAFEKAGRYVVLEITDTGIGMDEEVKKHIFEPFFTTKEKGKGTGMGLAMAYGVVKNHDGFITVESELGRGSTFTLHFPAVEREVKGDAVREESLPHGKGTILVVDDEDFIRTFAREMLLKLGYSVLEASDGLDALTIYTGNKEKINMVILDLIMPKMGGEATFRKLKSIDPGVKVLISSGFGISEKTQEMMKDPSIVGFIQKPYNITEIAGVIKKALSAA